MKTILFLLFLGCMQYAFSVNDSLLTQNGVSRELALLRKANLDELKYKLHFSIPEQREQAVTGNIDISFNAKNKFQLLIDFRASTEQIKKVALNEKENPFKFNN